MEDTIYLIEDDAAARSSTQALIVALGFQSREFESAEEFLQQHDPSNSGCVLTDLRLRGMSGIELLEALNAMNDDMPVVILTAYAKTQLTVRAMRSGAINVLDKPVDEDQLWEALREGLNVDRDRRLRRKRELDLSRRFDELTEQESQVLEMIVNGMTNRQIASQLRVSTRTVESRRHNIFRKTEASSIPELVKLTVAMRGDEA